MRGESTKRPVHAAVVLLSHAEVNQLCELVVAHRPHTGLGGHTILVARGQAEALKEKKRRLMDEYHKLEQQIAHNT